MTQSIRNSSYGDYIAVDLVGEDGNILSTPFYIKNKKEIEVWWAWPSSERTAYPVTTDDWYEKYLFKYENKKLFVKWLNGPCFGNSTFTEVIPEDLPDWNFQYARKIISH